MALLPLPLYLLWPPATSRRGAAFGLRRKVLPRVPLAQGPAGLAAGVAGAGAQPPSVGAGVGLPDCGARAGHASAAEGTGEKKRKRGKNHERVTNRY